MVQFDGHWQKKTQVWACVWKEKNSQDNRDEIVNNRQREQQTKDSHSHKKWRRQKNLAQQGSYTALACFEFWISISLPSFRVCIKQ